METYEKSIGLKTIWQTIIRRWKIILVVMIPLALVTVVYTQAFMTKSYQSSATFINNTNLNATQHAQVVLQIQKEETITKTVEALANLEKPINVSASTISGGLSVTAFNSSNPGVVKFSYTSTNKSLVKPILAQLSEVALEEVKTNGFNNMKIQSSASAPTKVSKEKTYLLIGLAASVVLGCGFAFVDEIVSDEVYDKEDIERLGCAGFEVTCSGK